MQGDTDRIRHSRAFQLGALALWTAAALLASHSRSLWGDELIRLRQEQAGLLAGLRALFGEPSPFSPGELVLNWISGTLFSGWLPPEVWGRIPGVAWGAATLGVALSARIRYLLPLAAFSVSLFMLSAEMRPYGSLFFAGALAFRLLWEPREPVSRALEAAAWLALGFAHLYGICFVGFACALRRRWGKAAFAAIFAIAILLKYRLKLATGDGPHYPLTELLRQSLGTLGNPHKATFLLAPMFVLGWARLFVSERRLALELAALLAVSVIAPIAATIKAGYFFVPRQIVGGAFPYLAACAIGFETVRAWLERRWPGPRWRRGARAGTAAACALVSVVPWTLSVALRKPPFPNQPMHRFREVAERIASDRLRAVLSFDACNRENLEYYLSERMGAPTSAPTHVERAGNDMVKTCWAGGTCLYSVVDMRLCSTGAEGFAPGTAPARLLSAPAPTPAYDLLVYSTESLPRDLVTIPAARTW